MGLKESKITPNLSRDAKLWRYMTLDKLVNLLSTNKLFFTPTISYLETDPFEGLLPKVALDAMRKMYSAQIQQIISDAEKARDHFFKIRPNLPSHVILEKQIEFQKLLDDNNLFSAYEKNHFRILKSTVVNCWHRNESESEAMWRLYSENNKGVAIQTTMQNLIDSIDDERVFLSEVRYIDFYDVNLKTSDCVVNGNIGPLLKREAFKHEQEVRLFFQPSRNYRVSDEEYKYAPELVDVDRSKLVSKIYISPYVTEPYLSSVKVIAKQFGISDSDIIHSSLLTPDQNLTKLY